MALALPDFSSYDFGVVSEQQIQEWADEAEAGYAWFPSAYKAQYGVEASAGFPVPMSEFHKTLDSVVKEWKEYVRTRAKGTMAEYLQRVTFMAQGCDGGDFAGGTGLDHGQCSAMKQAARLGQAGRHIRARRYDMGGAGDPGQIGEEVHAVQCVLPTVHRLARK